MIFVDTSPDSLALSHEECFDRLLMMVVVVVVVVMIVLSL
jgi:hypothetical protein